ncbi:MAG TPA: hypothetical protein VK116_04365, partial [Planctomycetota bacterium]|nr:hypothetical protein [Planctomycetota bacterium]
VPLAGVILMALFTPIALVADAKVARAQSALEQGAELFSKGDFVEAARAFEEGSDTKDLLLRKFNAGVSYLRANELDEALRRFEEVSSRANGELRDAARQNAAWCHFERGSKRFAAARALAKNSSDPAASTTPPSPDVAAATDDPLSAQLDEYRKAAESFRLALDLYRKLELGLVDDAAAASIARDVSVTKTALVAALDEVARLEEEIARREDEKMLEDPPAMIARILAIEKLHRGIARELAHAPRSERRIGARRLQRAEEENRRRAELLLHFLRERAEEARQAEEARASSRSSTSGGALESRVSELIAERRGMLGQGTLPDEMREKLEQEVILLEDLLSRIPRMSDEERTTLEKELDAMIASESGADAQMSGAAIKEAAEAVGRAVDAQLEAASRYAARSPGDAVRH